MLVCCLFKLKDSFNRFKLSQSISESNLELEYIETLEELQEKIVYKNYDLSIIDKNIWWKEEAKDLFNLKNINVLNFQGDFKTLENLVLEYDVVEEEEELNLDEKLEKVNIKDKNNDIEVKYLIKEKMIEVPKVVYKTRNIRQEMISVLSETEVNIKNILGINLGLTFSKTIKTLIVDMSKYNNLVYLCDYKKSPVNSIIDKDINANNISDYSYLINDNLTLIECGKCEKETIKKILFAARDYEKIIFIIDDWKNNFAVLASHKVYIVTDPCLISIKINMEVIKNLKNQGQINENIAIVTALTNEVEKENIKYMYKQYEVDFINRSNHIILSNKRKVVKEEFYNKFNNEKDKTSIKKLLSKIKF